jgi:hypothetical protein
MPCLVLTRQYTFIENATHNHPSIGFGSYRQNLRSGLLLENVIDHLNRVHQARAHQIDNAALILFGGTNSDPANLSFVAKFAQIE